MIVCPDCDAEVIATRLRTGLADNVVLLVLKIYILSNPCVIPHGASTVSPPCSYLHLYSLESFNLTIEQRLFVAENIKSSFSLVASEKTALPYTPFTAPSSKVKFSVVDATDVLPTFLLLTVKVTSAPVLAKDTVLADVLIAVIV